MLKYNIFAANRVTDHKTAMRLMSGMSDASLFAKCA